MISNTELSLFLHSAELTRVTRTFRFMSPRVLLTLGDQKKISEKHKKGGKYPEWHQVIKYQFRQLFQLQASSEVQNLELAVYDSKVKSSRLIGTAKVDLQYAKAVGFIDEWIELEHKGKATGKLWIIMRVGEPSQDVLKLPEESLKVDTPPLYPSIPGLSVKLYDSKVVGLSYKPRGLKSPMKPIAQPKYAPPPFYDY